MGLSASISNALSGMSTSQASLEVLSRNVSNAGTPGYHKQSLTVIDTKNSNSVSARSGGVERAFNKSLQAYYTRASSDASYADTRSGVLDQLQTFFGKPGDPGSLDTEFSTFQNAMQSLSTSPDAYATRASVLSQAQAMASTLNSLSQSVQSLRQDTETQMASGVDTLNRAIASLATINTRLSSRTSDGATQASLEDQRDRLVSQISEQIDVQVDYRTDGSVALMTRTGVGILDVKASTFEFQPSGTITAEKQANVVSAKNGVGTLSLITPSGLKLDLVQQNVLQSGNLGALVELRDKTLVTAQDQLDQVAAGLAQAMSTVTKAGSVASSGAKNGFSLDVSGIQDGSNFTVDYAVGGVGKSIKVLNVADTSKLPLDYLDASGVRVIGVDFSQGTAAMATQLSGKLGSSFTVSGSGSTITVLDDGAAATTDVTAVTGHSVATALQNGDPALNLFVDSGNANYTGTLAGRGQQLGFAGRITVNSAILNDNKLLVQYQAGGSLGDSTRANYLLSQLQTMTFATPDSSLAGANPGRLGGTVSELVSQTMDHTGGVAADATSDADTQKITMETLSQRMDGEYGVNVDNEMAQLVQLQNAYAANSRVISMVQDLMNKLLEL